ncbi:response regulator transcription factor [Corynebacterium sp. MSK151]|uniref:response regulator transcription factor n=1 Tax=unclassified Corynebacterium TaxID=2624378 RepID=UPI00254FF566|nr:MULTISPECIES: response regulator transcription factor [unclassified Corynebacterium]MDK8759906.1 response regulator transcription factor [Corynebacterium sp. MSK151]MDK8848873.1 response regulator transcription factor [Corynebacterium sp. MSK047]
MDNALTGKTPADTAKPGAGHRVLVVDDEPAIVELLRVSLRFQGFEVATASDGRAAIDVAKQFGPDVIILDVMMPYLDGFETLTKLRASGISAPVLFLTARDSVDDKIKGLTMGGDDYVTKPFDLEEVVTRVYVLLRRGTGGLPEAEDTAVSFGPFRLDDASHEAFYQDELVELSPTEFSLLRFLIINHGVVLSKATILDNIWHYEFGGDGNLVETYISYLRRKIDRGPQHYIQTVRGVGYVLREPR